MDHHRLGHLLVALRVQRRQPAQSVRWHYRQTEPALRPIRRVMPDLGGIDISPIILLLILFFLRQFILTTIYPALV